MKKQENVRSLRYKFWNPGKLGTFTQQLISIVIIAITNIVWCGILSAQPDLKRIDASLFGGYTITDVAIKPEPNLAVYACGDMATLIRRDQLFAWTKVNVDVGDSVVFNDLEFADGMVGVGVGTDGTIIRTSDAGSTWSVISTGTLEHFRAVSFASATKVVCVGTNGIAMLSDNGGATWVRTETNTRATLYDVMALQSGAFIACGDAGTIATMQTGTSVWNIKSGTSTKTFYSVLFENSNRGWVGINGGVLFTSDGGETWTQQLNGIDGCITSLTRDANILAGAGSSNGVIAISIDGNLWQQIFIGDSVTTKSILISASEQAGVVTGEDGMIRSFSLVPPGFSEVGAYNAPFYFDHIRFNDGSLWSVGSNGAIHSRTSGGVWTVHETGTTALLTGIAATLDGGVICVSGADGVVMRSTNNGSTWSSISLPSPQPLSAISFNGSFWAVGKENIYVSADGSSWSQAGSIAGTSLLDVEALSSDEAIVCGTGGIAAKTTNQGSSWITFTSNTTATFMDCDVDMLGNGIFVGQYGIALTLENGNTTLSNFGGNISNEMITSVRFLNVGTIVATTISGKIVYISGLSGRHVYDGATQFTDVELENGEITAVGEGGTVMLIQEPPVSVQESTLAYRLLIRPNPANTSLNIEWSMENGEQETGNVTPRVLVVSDVRGQLVLKQRIEPGVEHQKLNVGTWPVGVYSIILQSASGDRIASDFVTISR